MKSRPEFIPALFCSVMIVSLFVASCYAFPDGDPGGHRRDRELCLEVLADFLRKDSDLEKTQLERLLKKAKHGSVRHSQKHGYTYTLITDLHRASVALEQKRVTSIIYPGNIPETFSRRESALKKASVKLDKDQALTVASDYVLKHAGEQALDDLKLTTLVADKGSMLVYYFSWSDSPEEDGVSYGIREFTVEVNPTTGKVWTYMHLESGVSSQPKISGEQCRAIAMQHFGNDPRLMIGAINYFEIMMPNGPPKPTWFVHYTSKAESWQDYFHGTLEIDPETGEIRPPSEQGVNQ